MFLRKVPYTHCHFVSQKTPFLRLPDLFVSRCGAGDLVACQFARSPIHPAPYHLLALYASLRDAPCIFA